MIKYGGPSQAIGEALRVQAHQMFHWWHWVRDGTLTQPSVAHAMRLIRREVERLLEAGQQCGVPASEGVSRGIFKLRQALWTFVRHDRVEPTNNAVGRAICPGIRWPKGNCGILSPTASRFVETLMMVVVTLKQRHPNVLDYATAVYEAALRGEPAPSLRPTPAQLEQFRCPAA